MSDFDMQDLKIPDRQTGLLQDLSNSGINPFGVVLVAESFLKSPMAELSIKNEKPIEIIMPINRQDTPKYIGVKITLIPILR